MRDYSHTDPEFTERFEYFAFNEVVNEEGQQLDDITRHMAIVATLIGCQGIDEFRLEASRFRWRDRQPPRWKTGWKKAYRHRWISSALI